jgi:hypothetical protein
MCGLRVCDAGEATAVGLAKIFSSHHFVATLCLTHDLLPHMTRLFLMFQVSCVQSAEEE